MILREVFGHCAELADPRHSVEQLFFLADASESGEEVQEQVMAEAAHFNDVVFVGGPDSDPPVPRDATYVLDRPTSRGYRLAYGTAWLAEHRPELDYVMYLDDDSYLNLPRLLQHVEAAGSPSLVMGFVMETLLDVTQTAICDLCDPCVNCLQDQGLAELCSLFPRMTLGGCMQLLNQCRLFNDGDDVYECISEKQRETERVAGYFGARETPRWLLGMGWVFGSRIVRFLARNVDDLKKQGAADVQLGFWLAAIEGLQWVDMKGGYFHDYPMPGSTFSAGCTDLSVLVHRMNTQRWADFDSSTCLLRCPASAETS